MSGAANYLAPDGFRYGVMFNDGAVLDRWNGITQRQRAQSEADRLAVKYARDNITLAKRVPGSDWVRS